MNEEKITCPECWTQQIAEIKDTEIFPVYIHHCIKCEFIIMESDWHPSNQEWK